MGWGNTIRNWRARRAEKRQTVDILDSFNLSIPWLSDSELGALMDALEQEQVNRMAYAAGYYDTDIEMWVDTRAAVREVA